MRNRMIQLGYTAAKGVLNFVDDGYIEPFAFSADTCRGSRTFVISPKETLEEYVRNQAFRDCWTRGTTSMPTGIFASMTLRMWCCTTASCA